MYKVYLVPILYLVSTLILFVIDHYWNDRRTIKYKKARIGFVIICFVIAFVNAYIFSKHLFKCNQNCLLFVYK